MPAMVLTSRINAELLKLYIATLRHILAAKDANWMELAEPEKLSDEASEYIRALIQGYGALIGDTTERFLAEKIEPVFLPYVDKAARIRALGREEKHAESTAFMSAGTGIDRIPAPLQRNALRIFCLFEKKGF